MVHCFTSQIEFLAKECLPALPVGLFLVEELAVAVQNAVKKSSFLDSLYLTVFCFYSLSGQNPMN